MRVAVGAILVGVMLTVSGCSFSIGGTKIDQKKAQEYLKKELPASFAGTTYEGATVSEVSCPKDVKAEKDKTFVCDFTLSTGEEGTVTMTMTNDDGGVTYEGDDIVIAGAQ